MAELAMLRVVYSQALPLLCVFRPKKVHPSDRLPFPLEFRNHLCYYKNHTGGATRLKFFFHDTFIRFDTTPACDRHVATAIAALCYASREQKVIDVAVLRAGY